MQQDTRDMLLNVLKLSQEIRTRSESWVLSQSKESEPTKENVRKVLRLAKGIESSVKDALSSS